MAARKSESPNHSDESVRPPSCCAGWQDLDETLERRVRCRIALLRSGFGIPRHRSAAACGCRRTDYISAPKTRTIWNCHVAVTLSRRRHGHVTAAADAAARRHTHMRTFRRCGQRRPHDGQLRAIAHKLLSTRPGAGRRLAHSRGRDLAAICAGDPIPAHAVVDDRVVVAHDVIVHHGRLAMDRLGAVATDNMKPG